VGKRASLVVNKEVFRIFAFMRSRCCSAQITIEKHKLYHGDATDREGTRSDDGLELDTDGSDPS
jgi:hypothetical protein